MERMPRPRAEQMTRHDRDRNDLHNASKQG